MAYVFVQICNDIWLFTKTVLNILLVKNSNFFLVSQLWSLLQLWTVLTRTRSMIASGSTCFWKCLPCLQSAGFVHALRNISSGLMSCSVNFFLCLWNMVERIQTNSSLAEFTWMWMLLMSHTSQVSSTND
jgi:hypothetical protein